MRVSRFENGSQTSYGFIEEDDVLEISGLPYLDHYVTGRQFPLDCVKLLTPVEPSKIVAVGLNYKDHAAELGMELPDEPVLFLKPPSSLTGPGADIVMPRRRGRTVRATNPAYFRPNSARSRIFVARSSRR